MTRHRSHLHLEIPRLPSRILPLLLCHGSRPGRRFPSGRKESQGRQQDPRSSSSQIPLQPSAGFLWEYPEKIYSHIKIPVSQTKPNLVSPTHAPHRPPPPPSPSPAPLPPRPLSPHPHRPLSLLLFPLPPFCLRFALIGGWYRPVAISMYKSGPS